MYKKIFSVLVLAIAFVSNMSAQTLTLKSTKNDVSAAEAATYDRVEYVRQVQAGTTVLVSFPAKLDGYYFGPDAERLLVTSVTEGTEGKLNIITESMADTDDFLPNQKYLVSPTQNLDVIVSLTPAKKTTVPATTESLVCKTIDNTQTAIAEITVVSKDPDHTVYDLTGKKLRGADKPGIYIIHNRKVMKLN